MSVTKRLYLVLLLLAFAGPALASPVTIQVGAYQGRYYIPGIGGPFYGDQTFDLAAGTYQLDNGAEIGGSALLFDVDAAGTVSNVIPAAAASASGSTLAFNTATIAIAPGAYTGRYFLSIFGTAVELRGSQNVALLPGLAYTIDDGAESAVGTQSSAFIFAVDDVGNVSTTSPAAQADGTSSTLTFLTTPIQIDPQAYPGPYVVTSFAPTVFTGAQTLNVLRGLVYTIDNGQGVGGSAFAIVVDAAGQVSTPSGAASAAGNVVTLANIVVHVDGSASGVPFSVGPYANLTQPTDVVLIPTLAVVVTTPAGSGVAVPAVGAFDTVPPLGVVLAGAPFNTTRQTKVDLLAALRTFRAGVTDRVAGWLLDLAVASVSASLDASLWTSDGMHLVRGRGEAVFQLEKDAAIVLDSLISWRHSDLDAQALRAFVTGFAHVDRQLASTAIDDAGTRPIGDARRDLAQGDDDLTRGHVAPAFEHYRDAWQDAVRSHEDAR